MLIDTVQYADDCQFLIKGKVEDINNIVNRAEETLTKAKNCFYKNGLLINFKKNNVSLLDRDKMSQEYLKKHE